MKAQIILFVFLMCLSSFAWPATSCCTKSKSISEESALHGNQKVEQNDKEINEILSKMNDATKQLKSCQANLSYLFIQDPDLLDSRTLRNGVLYYQKTGERSQLRIQFNDIKQEDFEPEKRREEYLFDGVWLTRVDFKLKQIDLYQKAEEDNPIDVFELISDNFPLIGFSNIDQLRKDYNIQQSESPNKNNKSITLLLNAKKGSGNEKEYNKIDFQANSTTYMPERIVAYSSQGDIHDIQFKEFEINKKLKKAVFTIETPPDFRKNVERLEKKPIEKGN